jgi:hypothetical protein
MCPHPLTRAGLANQVHPLTRVGVDKNMHPIVRAGRVLKPQKITQDQKASPMYSV